MREVKEIKTKLRVGVALTGSFCTFDAVFLALAKQKDHLQYQFILSETVQTLPNRFYTLEQVLSELRKLSSDDVIRSITEAEPLAPRAALDVLLIAPCTGNTLAKLANGITDTSVLMAAKGQLRNHKPVVICLASNDALGRNLKNIGLLLGSKDVYFVPFYQDAPEEKPSSLISNPEHLFPTIQAALQGKQLQPIIYSCSA